MSNSIKVVARFRPQNRTEIEVGGQPIVAFETEDTCRLDVGILSCFTETDFDRMYSPKRHQVPLPLTGCLT
jgi:hypothetical protein